MAPRVALLQLDAAVPDRLGAIEDALDRAAADGAALLVAPELATSGYGAGDRFAAESDAFAAVQLPRLAAAVAATGVALVVGHPRRDGAGVVNAATVLRPGLPPVGYGKAQLYGAYERDHFAVAPVETVVVDVAGLKVGVLICFDVEFPEHVRRLAREGADLVAVPTALPDQPGSDFVAERVVPVRAFENQLFVAYAGWSGRDSRFAYAGRSALVAPDGRDLLRAPADRGFLGIATVDPAAFAESRALNPYLAELRPARPPAGR
ncbi:nitrilase-related carbon-nitrogen hydrolase [Oharaeibacter diazotrophicus]|uniref:Putative amidohydrolase n=1 Tax=Oharaeibacter diazotrophicus TaxID=1920512 RepID=A0A4R6R7G3_9HYPH|nr:nitrilase-related carbon-nitrogen hydrolase [Oharaeibacter diazotrophicus]TDP81822.1 putative amidohydrolase [Oharaeibacter diazotrophicus]BBE73454.1 (R)-stereoselective amidase [Pleomorphomonas sp. SM30]GLS75244.1 hydrolase [Oharaeibacter diazotrophicus]